MDIPENNDKKIALAVVMVVIVVLALIAVVWKSKTKKEAQIQTKIENTGIAGPDGKIFPAPAEMPKIQVPDEVTSILGTIEKIEGKILTVKAFFFGEQKTFTVTVGDATKIQKKEVKKEIPKSEEEKPIEPFVFTDATFSDIRQNDNVSIEASENIRGKTSFIAKTIFIEIMNDPAPPPSEIIVPPAIPQIPK